VRNAVFSVLTAGTMDTKHDLSSAFLIRFNFIEIIVVIHPKLCVDVSNNNVSARARVSLEFQK
jgi:hypothetical protein